ncbi:MAG: hypothetical protein HKN47_28915, partial [Pirellulaceae bacterium]|nr:hypothetical protein [Pirellulaceae bacterium]
MLPRYDVHRTYQWNYDHPPDVASAQSRDTPSVAGTWDFCSLPVDSPLGIAAGPLLNGQWCLYYAALGFDVLTYKTVRSRPRECYPLPNLQNVRCDRLTGQERHVQAATEWTGSWAVSFGMPSMDPEIWRRDVQA